MSTDSRAPSTKWREVYLGGSQRSEDLMIESWALETQELQRKIASKNADATVRRGFQAKQHLGVDNAEFVVFAGLPGEVEMWPFMPGVRYPAIVRLSNGSGDIQPDRKRDLRGLGMRIQVSADVAIDLLGTSGAVSFARDPAQFMEFARATTGSRLMAIPSLISSIGPFETIRMLRTVLKDTSRGVRSLATEQFWSRGAFRFGKFAIRFTFAPVETTAPEPDTTDPDYLRHEIATRLGNQVVEWDLKVQFFTDEESTPVEDAATAWDTEYVPIGRLTIPVQDVTEAGHALVERAVDAMEYNPWNTTEELRPIGSINRARRRIYEASAEERRHS